MIEIVPVVDIVEFFVNQPQRLNTNFRAIGHRHPPTGFDSRPFVTKAAELAIGCSHTYQVRHPFQIRLGAFLSPHGKIEVSIAAPISGE